MNIDLDQIIGSRKDVGANSPDVFEVYSLNNGVLHGVNCTKCNNTGRTVENRNGILYTIECECMNVRRALFYLRKSGLQDTVKHYTFDNFKTPNSTTIVVKKRAEQFAAEKGGSWFFINGERGSGKTHICTAIAGKLMESGKSLKYVLWRELAQELKASINETEYQEIMKQLKNVDVLYIDDFLKGSVSDSDINRAYEVINARYNLKTKKTLISSERSLEQIDSYDSAISDRIRERAENFIFNLNGINWRRKCYTNTAYGTAPSLANR